jgi:multidrug resistance efflux pump
MATDACKAEMRTAESAIETKAARLHNMHQEYERRVKAEREEHQRRVQAAKADISAVQAELERNKTEFQAHWQLGKSSSEDAVKAVAELLHACESLDGIAPRLDNLMNGACLNIDDICNFVHGWTTEFAATLASRCVFCT